jgi:hypothetical protein
VDSRVLSAFSWMANHPVLPITPVSIHLLAIPADENSRVSL